MRQCPTVDLVRPVGSCAFGMLFGVVPTLVASVLAFTMQSSVDDRLERINERLRNGQIASSLGAPEFVSLSSMRFRRVSRDADSETLCQYLSQQPTTGKISEETLLLDTFGENPIAYCLLLEEKRSHDEFDATAIALAYLGYSTWDGRCLFLDTISVLQSQPKSSLPIRKLFMYTLTEVADSIGCSRFVWRTWDSADEEKRLNDEMGAQTLHGWLTLRLDDDRMEEFLQQRRQSREFESEPCDSAKDGEARIKQPSLSALSRDFVETKISHCLRRSNDVLGKTTKHEDGTFVQLRLASVDDVDAMMDLINGLAIYEDEADAVHIGVDTLRVDGFGSSKPLYYCFLLEKTESGSDARIPIGIGLWYIGFASSPSPPQGSRTDDSVSGRGGRFVYLEDLFILEEHRGRGGGKAIMFALADVGLALGCTSFVWQALEWDPKALKFYHTKVGARTVDGYLTVRFDRERMDKFLASVREESKLEHV